MSADPRQLGLFETASAASARSFDELFAALNRLFRGRLAALVLTDARTRMLSVRRLPGESPRYALRLHRCFAAAPDEALAAVATWVKSGRRSPRSREALAVLRRHFAAHRAATSAPPRPRAPLRPQGRTLDLGPLCADLDRRYFGGELAVDVTWGRGAVSCDPLEAGAGRAARGRRRRSRRPTLQLGSFDHDLRLVRIHPVLDAPSVPRYVVASIVFHELLHAALPPVERGGRRLLHPPEFRRRERLFPDHARAERWIARHLSELLRARRQG
ncbi:MAG TPA: hypothetical protein VGC93_12605 [Thermoanaerobaculia bacterium]